MYIPKSILIGVVVLVIAVYAASYYWLVYKPTQNINAYKLPDYISGDLAPTSNGGAAPLPDYILKDLQPTK